MLSRDWIYLLSAGVLEIAWLATVKYSEGFTRLLPTLLLFALAILASYLISLAVRTIPAGTVYAVWTGIGVCGGSIMGILLFNESRDLIRIASIAAIMAGIIGLQLSYNKS